VHARELVAAAAFAPALVDFDALLFLRRDALPGADCALQGAKLLRTAAEKRGFAEAAADARGPAGTPVKLPAQAAAGAKAAASQDGRNGSEAGSSKRARAVLRAIPAGRPRPDPCIIPQRVPHLYVFEMAERDQDPCVD
jgi:hypothetical protein